VNKTSISIGIIMLAAAVTGIYLDDLTYRLIAGAMFLIGAVLLYYTIDTLANTTDDATGSDDVNAIKNHPVGAEYRQGIPVSAEETNDGELPRFQAGFVQTGRKLSVEIPEEYYKPASESAPLEDPRAEFDFLTRRLLLVLKDHLIAYTAALLWINHDRQQIVIGEFVTDSRHFTTARRLQLGNDLVTQIGTSGKPQILSNLNPTSEQEMIVYYDAHENLKSFVGVPLFFMDEPIAVLVADSTAPDAFGMETVATIGKFTTLIALLLSSYNQKFDLAADAKLLAVIDRMRDTIQKHMDRYGVADATVTAATEILDWDYVAVILFTPEKQNWTVIKSHSKSPNIPYIAEGVSIDIEGSVLRSVFDGELGQIIDVPRHGKYRFHEKEAIASEGQMCAVPLVRGERWLGLAVVEYRESHQYAKRDLEVFRHIADVAGTYLDMLHFEDLSRKHLMIDVKTRLASRNLLLQRLTEETQRLKVHDGQGVFCLLALDSPDETLHRYGQTGLDGILRELADIVKKHLNGFDVAGKFDLSRFGAIMIQTSAEDAFLRCEKIRKEIASHLLTCNGSSFSVTASISGCVFTGGMDIDQILKIAQQAMDRALSDGGNCAKIV